MTSDKINTLIVEDIPELNEVYSKLLAHEMQINVVGSAHNRRELKEILDTTDVDVIVMDVEMESRFSGIDYCREITAEYADIKIIMLTCHEEENAILLSFEAGANDYILKSSSLSELIATIKDVYAGNPSIHGYAASVIRKELKSMDLHKRQLLQITMALTKLTHTEQAILILLLDGKKQKEIALERSIELVTVKAHITNILKKFGVARTKILVQQIKGSGLEDFVQQLATSV